MIHKNRLLSILSDAEQEALYGLPDFDDGQRFEFLSLSETELTLAGSLAAHPAKRTLHLPERRQHDRPGRAPGGAGVWMTEISGVPA